MSAPNRMGGADMTVSISLNSQIGVELASRLGLQIDRREGHDLVGPCISCQSSDAFRLHPQTGVGCCYSCHRKWSPFQVAETVLRDREGAQSLIVQIGAFQSNGSSQVATVPIDPVEAIARQKHITPESLRAFGAQASSASAIKLPAYGPDGKPCTSFLMAVQGGKGAFSNGKPAGLAFAPV